MNPPSPPGFTHPQLLALKAAIGCGLAIGLCNWVGNPDIVSATFVTIVCITPTLLTGLRRASTQLFASLVGGGIGAVALALHAPLIVGIPVAVGLAILASFRARIGHSYAVAAFTALFVQAVPRGDAIGTLEVRLVAVSIAAASAFIANFALTGFAYESIFARRIGLLEGYVDGLLAYAEQAGPTSVVTGLEPIALLRDELMDALGELRWRRSRRTLRHVEAVFERVHSLRHLVHAVYQLGLAVDELGIHRNRVVDLVHWARSGVGDPPETPPEVAREAQRVIRARQNLGGTSV